MPNPPAPGIVAVDMGYGHLRAAQALADAAGTDVLRADQPPLADAREARLWARVRRAYETTSRLSQAPLGAPWRLALDAVTRIAPLHPPRDLSAADAGVRLLERLVARGVGSRLARELADGGRALVTTYFVPALAADLGGVERVACVVTDTDLSRAWVPADPARSRILYLAPSRRAARRLLAYGVRPDRVRYTGFPLPPELLGGPDLPAARAALARRLVRLDPRGVLRARLGDELDRVVRRSLRGDDTGPPHVVFAVGGAGAQIDLARRLVPALAGSLRAGRLRLTLVAGARPHVAAALRGVLGAAGLEEGTAADVLYEPEVGGYFRRFHALLGEADVLWTKPSEMTFFAALGLPLVLAPPVGVHERYNQRWAMEHGAAVTGRPPEAAAGWLAELIEDGTLAGAAWAGFRRLPQLGTYRILEAVGAWPGERPLGEEPG